MIEIEYIIVILILVVIIVFNTYSISCLENEVNSLKKIEGFNNSDLSNEALANIASIYNNKNLTVTNLNVTGNLTVAGNSSVQGNTTTNGTASITGKLTTGSAKIGLYELRGERIGIPGRADLYIDKDKWCRLTNYNDNALAGVPAVSGGFMSANTVVGTDGMGGNIFTNMVNGKPPIGRYDKINIIYSDRYLRACSSGDGSKCKTYGSDPWASWGTKQDLLIV